MTDIQSRRPRSDKGQKRGPQRSPRPKHKAEIMLTLLHENIAWAREMVSTGEYSSISEYVDHLISTDRINRLLI